MKGRAPRQEGGEPKKENAPPGREVRAGASEDRIMRKRMIQNVISEKIDGDRGEERR
jgi:hypothetical protein